MTPEIKKVLENQCCIGCGICVASVGGRVDLNELGMYHPQLPEGDLDKASYVCPFTDKGGNEDTIGRELFEGLQKKSEIGYFRNLRVGHVVNDVERGQSSSGGILTWVLKRLLEAREVDYVIHVQPSQGAAMYRYAVSETAAEVQAGSKSRYYPIELSEMVSVIRARPDRVAIVALPCFAKGLRKLTKAEPVFKSKIKFILGIVCGHLKSASYANFIASQLGVSPYEHKKVDFRVKIPSRPASGYGASVTTEKVEAMLPMSQIFGGNWGFNLFRNPACDLCDDVFAECADMAVGDAWLPDYLTDWKGNSIVVTRNETLEDLIEDGVESGVLDMSPISSDRIIQSQAGGLRDRREGLSYRLALREREGKWSPRKRVSPGRTHVNRKRRKIYRLRAELGAKSHRLWQESLVDESDPMSRFAEKVRPLMNQIERLNISLVKRIFRRVRKAYQRK